MQDVKKPVIDAIRELFIIRDDCYAQQLEGLNEYKVINQTFSDDIIKKHLKGLITVGSFQVEPKSNKVKWICFDFDGIIEEEFEKAKRLFEKILSKGMNPILEFSGRRGFHIWLFIEPVDLSVARQFALEISKNEIISDIYPKNSKIEKNGYGTQVKLPLGVHRASNKRSYFFNSNFKPMNYIESMDFLINLSKKERDKIKITNIKSFLGE